MASGILLVSADAELIASVRRTVSAMGRDLVVVGTLDEASLLHRERDFEALLVQADSSNTLATQGSSGGFRFRRDLPVIAVAKNAAIRDAVKAIRAGAWDYLSASASNLDSLQRDLRSSLSGTWHRSVPPSEGQRTGTSGEFITSDYRMITICGIIAAVADSKASLLIEGESGTGKTLIARMLHEQSGRRNRSFVEVNCGSLSETLIESELFGHVRGAFTSAYRDRCGKFELADGGTLLLDEVGNASLELQSKLLHVVETGEFERVGDSSRRRSDVRLAVAANKSLKTQVAQGRFREDLYHRLNAVKVEVPPLRERVGDIPLLARHFLRVFASQHRRDVTALSAEVLALLVRYSWPGNVRELRNVVEHGVILTQGELADVDSLPQHVVESLVPIGLMPSPAILRPLREALREPERRCILEALKDAGWNKQHAAHKLRISRSTLYKKMKDLGLEREESETQMMISESMSSG